MGTRVVEAGVGAYQAGERERYSDGERAAGFRGQLARLDKRVRRHPAMSPPHLSLEHFCSLFLKLPVMGHRKTSVVEADFADTASNRQRRDEERLPDTPSLEARQSASNVHILLSNETGIVHHPPTLSKDARYAEEHAAETTSWTQTNTQKQQL